MSFQVPGTLGPGVSAGPLGSRSSRCGSGCRRAGDLRLGLRGRQPAEPVEVGPRRLLVLAEDEARLLIAQARTAGHHDREDPLQAPAELMLFSGMALGYRDASAPISRSRSTRWARVGCDRSSPDRHESGLA